VICGLFGDIVLLLYKQKVEEEQIDVIKNVFNGYGMECTDAKTLQDLVSLPKKLFRVAVSSDGIF
jgi:hypothetical protein